MRTPAGGRKVQWFLARSHEVEQKAEQECRGDAPQNQDRALLRSFFLLQTQRGRLCENIDTMSEHIISLF